MHLPNAVGRTGWALWFSFSLAFSACSEQARMPLDISPEGPRASQAVQAGGGLRLISNREPYRASRHTHATGRSGSAQLTLRALLGKQGGTSLELSTGTLEGTGTSGTLEGVQWKVFSFQGKLLETGTDRPRSSLPSALYTLDYLPRGTRIQVQATVRGVDGKRTDVVTATEEVRLRPDLAATSLVGPRQAVVATPVVFTAQFSELNRDLGARADCLLEANGVEVDRAQGIWVAEGDAVECRFQHRFAQLGTHRLRARIVSVRPGDWDEGNNSTESSIEVVPATVRMSGYAQASQSLWTREAHSLGELRHSQGTQSWDYRDHWKGGSSPRISTPSRPREGHSPSPLWISPSLRRGARWRG